MVFVSIHDSICLWCTGGELHKIFKLRGSQTKTKNSADASTSRLIAYIRGVRSAGGAIFS